MARRRGLMAPPPSFLWTRRIVLSLLTLFALGILLIDLMVPPE